MKKSNGHIAWLTGNREAFYFAGDVYIAPVSNAFDVRCGARQGRFECSRAHWNRYFEAVFAAQIVGAVDKDFCGVAS